MKRIIVILLCVMMSFSLAACGGGGDDVLSPSPSPSPDGTEEPPEENYRVARDFTAKPAPPSDVIEEDKLPKAPEGSLSATGTAYSMTSGGMKLELLEAAARFTLSVAQEAGSTPLFTNAEPVRVFVRAGKKETLTSAYTAVSVKDYGYLASAEVTTANGSVIAVEDRYYFPREAVAGAFNVRRAVIVKKLASGDTGYASAYEMDAASSDSAGYQWFIPNRVFGEVNGNVCYSETMLGLPYAMMRSASGSTLSLGRYQPVVHYENNSYASIAGISSGGAGVEVTYPSRDGTYKYRKAEQGAQSVYDLTMCAMTTESYEEAASKVYNAHFTLQNQRIVDTDIDEVYSAVNEDFKTFLHETKQTNKQTGKKYNSYGLPWRISIEDGSFGPLTYQAGFVGQQIPAAYEMMLYGIKNNDAVSLQNGVNVLDFWVIDAEFMQASGIPKIWFDTWDNDFRSYPTFTRMAVDAMEGLLDAYRLAEAHGIDRPEWLDAVTAYANFLVDNQNSDGSWYRCYDWDGNAYVAGAGGIPEPPGNICDSFSKNNTTMPVRFLGKMYELTEDASYKTSAIAGGEYVYREIYPTHVYRGGTCDNPNVRDKEAGVYAMYCWDTMYMLTRQEKYIECLKQAAAFTMSAVQSFSIAVKDSSLKSAKPILYGYNDGMSFITCEASGVDNYIAFIYYELFRTYIISGEAGYLSQAEFIQQNTKSIMNWDGELGYKYKSLVAEASTISGFTFSSVDNGVWLAWCSVANVEPIAKMLTGFGEADVMKFKDTPLLELRSTLDKIGVGGKAHPVYQNTVAGTIK